MTGRILKHDEVQEQLGRGGTGRVYRARDLRLQGTIALKLLLPGQISGEHFRLRVAPEARAPSALNQCNIVILYDIDGSGALPVNRVLHYRIGAAGVVKALDPGLAKQQRLVTGDPNPRVVTLAILRHQPPALTHLIPSAPGGLDRSIVWCLEGGPACRVPRIEDVMLPPEELKRETTVQRATESQPLKRTGSRGGFSRGRATRRRQ